MLVERRVALLERLKTFRLKRLLVSSSDRVEVSEITFGRGERDRLRFDDLPNGHRVRWAHADERSHHGGDGVERSSAERTRPTSRRRPPSDHSLLAERTCCERHRIRSRGHARWEAEGLFHSRLDPSAQGRFDVARHALGHAPPQTRPFLSHLSCRHGDAKGQKPSWRRGENICLLIFRGRTSGVKPGESTRIMEAQPRRRLCCFSMLRADSGRKSGNARLAF